jgi:hypothetical protein
MKNIFILLIAGVASVPIFAMEMEFNRARYEEVHAIPGITQQLASRYFMALKKRRDADRFSWGNGIWYASCNTNQDANIIERYSKEMIQRTHAMLGRPQSPDKEVLSDAFNTAQREIEADPAQLGYIINGNRAVPVGYEDYKERWNAIKALVMGNLPRGYIMGDEKSQKG